MEPSSGLTGVEHRHFSSITLDAYKKLQGLTINKLSRINLFSGINNIGKTNLLEAVYLLARQNDFNGLVEVIHHRDKVPLDRLDPEWFVEQIPGDIRISGVFDGRPGRVSIRIDEETGVSLDKSRYLGSAEIGAEFDGVKQESVTRLLKDRGRGRETQAGSIRLLCPVVYSSPFFLGSPKIYRRLDCCLCDLINR